MTTPADLQTLLRSDKLDEAIEHLNAEVRKAPTSIDRRAQLAELLCVAGNLERADTVLSAIADIDPKAMIGVALFRQLVRAEQARQQFYSVGRLPEFVVKPDALLELELRAAIAAREGAPGELATLVAEREAARVPPRELPMARRSMISAIWTIYPRRMSRCLPRPASTFGSRFRASSPSSCANPNRSATCYGGARWCRLPTARTAKCSCRRSMSPRP
jgi:hypothetical protein